MFRPVRRTPIASLTVGLVALVGLAGCSGASSGSGAAGSAVLPTIQVTPDIKHLLAQPIAQPRTCPANRNGVTSGQQSPWVGTVDLSVYLRLSDRRPAIRAVGAFLRSQPRVERVFFESQREAYREFERLYTCSAQVSPRRLPASWRVVLTPGTTVAQRNLLVAQAQLHPGVEVVACDPSRPCVDVVRSVDPAIRSSASTAPSTGR